MQKVTISLEKPINNAHLVKDFMVKHLPWLDPWEVNVSEGMLNVVVDLINNIGAILGPNPSFYFFRISDESIKYEIYQRQLFVYFTPYTKDQSQLKALNQVVNHAINAAKGVCCKCSQDLVEKDLHDDDQLQKFPFLALLDKGSFRHTRYVCMSCCKQAWDVSTDNSTQSLVANQLHFDNVLAESDLESVFDGQENHQSIVMYNLEDIDSLEEEFKEGSKDQVARIKGLVKKIRKHSPNKKLANIPTQWRNFCDDLENRFPNFIDVIRFFRAQFALSSKGDGVVRIPNILLIGPPGVGKSLFLLSIADEIKTEIKVINVSGLQTGTILTGSEAYWSNSQPGMLFNSLVLSDNFANPIFVLDELCKARSDGSYDALSALHPLLEARQSRVFTDLSLPELKFDASHVIWIATANDIDKISKPILDRFTVFNIEEPSLEQMQMIIKNQYQSFINKNPSGKYFVNELNTEVLNKLCCFHPRLTKKILEQCFGFAAYDERKFISLDDVNSCVIRETKDLKNGIGFLANFESKEFDINNIKNINNSRCQN